MQNRFLNILGTGLTVLALSQIGGMLTGYVPLQRFAESTGAAPLPRPFTGSGGFEPFRSFRTFEIRRGSQISVISGREVSDRLSGPHRRKIPYYAAGMFMPLMDRSTVEAPFAYLFCRSGMFSGISAVRVITHLREDEREWAADISCL